MRTEVIFAAILLSTNTVVGNDVDELDQHATRIRRQEEESSSDPPPRTPTRGANVFVTYMDGTEVRSAPAVTSDDESVDRALILDTVLQRENAEGGQDVRIQLQLNGTD
jgi:hypothetical protein